MASRTPSNARARRSRVSGVPQTKNSDAIQRIPAKPAGLSSSRVSLALTTPPARPAALEWSRRANALLAQLSQTPDDRLALRKHLERVSDQVRQLRWEMERQAR